jgi:hypothetical protein
MQEYFDHAAPDGTLRSLGELGAEQEFYAMMKKNRQRQSGKSAEVEKQDVERQLACLRSEVHRSHGALPEQLQRPVQLLVQALLHAIVLCIQMVVPQKVLGPKIQLHTILHIAPSPPALLAVEWNLLNLLQDVAALLAEQARSHLLEHASEDDNDLASSVSMGALAHVLEAVLCAVPQTMLKKSIFASNSNTVSAWTETMGCSLITDKVCRALHSLSEHQQQVCSTVSVFMPRVGVLMVDEPILINMQRARDSFS